MLNEVLRQNPRLEKYQENYDNFKRATFIATELMIEDKGTNYTKDLIIKQFENSKGITEVDKLSKDAEYLKFLKKYGIDIINKKEIK